MTFFDDDNTSFMPDDEDFVSDGFPDFDEPDIPIPDFEDNPLSEEPVPQEEDDELKDVTKILEKLRKEREKNDETVKSSTLITERLKPNEATNSHELEKILDSKEEEEKKLPAINNVENAVNFLTKQNPENEPIYTYEDKPSEKLKEDISQGKESVWQALGRLDNAEGEEGIKTVKIRGADEEEETAEEMPEKKEYPEVRKYTNVIKKDQITFAKPKELETGGWKKVVFFLIACVAVGIFLGLKANSYYIANAGKASNLQRVHIKRRASKIMASIITEM